MPDGVVPGMFHSSPRLRRLVRLLRPFPRAVGEQVLAAMAVLDGLVRRDRFHQAHAWAAAQPGTERRPWPLALALLANHGRFCAEEAFLGSSTLDAAARHVVIEGAHHLPPPGTGTILLGFHLGPPRTWVRLRMLGHPVQFGGSLVTSAWDLRWKGVLDAGGVVYQLAGGAAQQRLPALFRLREQLRGGALVLLTADGPFGREIFRIDLPGSPLVVRAGWLSLRRMTGAVTLPVLTHRDGKRRVIVIHPALPPPAADVARDVTQCRAVLMPLIEDYVRRFPAQCRYLAFPPWPIPARGDERAATSAESS
jgi:hypothetical protein